MDNSFKIQKNNFYPTTFFCLIGYLIALNVRPVFQSNATLLIEGKEKNIGNIEEVYSAEGRGGFGDSSNNINNQIQILQSDEVVSVILSNEEVKNQIRELHQTLPERFQTSEYIKDHGGIDLVVSRKDLRDTIGTLLTILLKKNKTTLVEATNENQKDTRQIASFAS